MRYFLLILLATLKIICIAQCNCVELSFGEGKKVKKCESTIIFSTNSTSSYIKIVEIYAIKDPQGNYGRSYEGNFFATLSYATDYQIGEPMSLEISLKNGEKFFVDIVHSNVGLDNGIYQCNVLFAFYLKSYLKVLNSRLDSLTIIDENNQRFSIGINMNSDILIDQFNCLKSYGIEVESKSLSNEQLIQYLEGRNEPAVIHLRKVLDMYNLKMELNGTYIIKDALDKIISIDQLYLKSKFVLLYIEDFIIGGKILTIIFQDKPDKVFRVVIKTYSVGEPSLLIEFEELVENRDFFIDAYNGVKILHNSEYGF